MKKYCISYVTNGGLTMLNNVVMAHDRAEAIEDLKGDTGVAIVLSCIEVIS